MSSVEFLRRSIARYLQDTSSVHVSSRCSSPYLISTIYRTGPSKPDGGSFWCFGLLKLPLI